MSAVPIVVTIPKAHLAQMKEIIRTEILLDNHPEYEPAWKEFLFEIYTKLSRA